MKRPLCWIGLGSLTAAVVFCCLYPAWEWTFPVAALLGVTSIFCLLGRRTRPAALFSFSAAFMLLFCVFFGQLYADPARVLDGQSTFLSGTVLETGRASFLLDGETENGRRLKVQIWCNAEMVPDRFQQFSGTVRLSAIAATDRFDSESYYRSRGVYLQGQLESGSFSGTLQLSPLFWPGQLNDFLCQRIRYALPGKYSGLVCAVVLGNRSHLPEEQYALFQQLGIQHLLAVSGMHLTMLTALFSLILSRFVRNERLKTALLMVFVLFYMLLTGLSPSIARAGIMLLLSFLAQLLFRRADPPTSLAAAVLAMLLQNPFLAMNIGFQFSVCSTIGVQMLAGPFSEKLLSFGGKAVRSKTAARLIKAFSVAFCGYLCALPLTALYDSRLIPMAIPANLLLSPLFTPVLATAAGCTLFCPVPVLGPVFAFLARLFIDCFLGMATFLCRIGPPPLFWNGPAPVIALIAAAVAVGYGATKGGRRRFAAALCLAAIISCACISTQSLLENHQVHCYTAVFNKRLLQIFSYGGHAVVVGHLSSQSQIEQAALELRREGVLAIDALILLPASGSPRVSLSALTEEFSVGMAVWNPSDNLSTQTAESLEGIPSRISDSLGITFWQDCSIRLSGGGAVDIRIGAKKLLILPADCAILYENESEWDLVLTGWDTSPPVQAGILLCARDFWGKENQLPHGYLLPYGRGVRCRIPIEG
ncbi:MAG: ComEC/Rec2 family competence protein [Oscillospiraceae bacterium]|nr:ComEC/Rec2 family competence protein [Oscillospiraceae bacterium]